MRYGSRPFINQKIVQMSLTDTGRGWVYSSNKSFLEEANGLTLKSETLLDNHVRDLQQKFDTLESLILDTCTFSGEASFDDLPVAENAATLVTLTAKDCVNLTPGDSGGVKLAWQAATKVAAIDVSGNGWSQAQVNAFLVALKAAVDAGMSSAAAACTLDISGNAVPSGAGATAVTALAADSPAWTITADE